MESEVHLSDMGGLKNPSPINFLLSLVFDFDIGLQCLYKVIFLIDYHIKVQFLMDFVF